MRWTRSRPLRWRHLFRRSGRFLWREPVFLLQYPPLVAIEAPHAVFAAGLDHRRDLTELTDANSASACRAGTKDLALRHADSISVEIVETLADHPDEAICKLGANVPLNLRGEGHTQSRERFGAGRRMHGCQHKMPGLGRVQRQPHHFRRAHFADHEYVRILA